MVDWHSPTQLAHDARMSVSRLLTLLDVRFVYHNTESFSNLVHIFFGLYL